MLKVGQNLLEHLKFLRYLYPLQSWPFQWKKNKTQTLFKKLQPKFYWGGGQQNATNWGGGSAKCNKLRATYWGGGSAKCNKFEGGSEKCNNWGGVQQNATNWGGGSAKCNKLKNGKSEKQQKKDGTSCKFIPFSNPDWQFIPFSNPNWHFSSSSSL